MYFTVIGPKVSNIIVIILCPEGIKAEKYSIFIESCISSTPYIINLNFFANKKKFPISNKIDINASYLAGAGTGLIFKLSMIFRIK